MDDLFLTATVLTLVLSNISVSLIAYNFAQSKMSNEARQTDSVESIKK